LMFPVLLDKVGLSTTFFIFVVLGLAAITFVKKFLPETKGLTLEQLELYFRNYKKEDEDNSNTLNQLNKMAK
jgi:MFS transporter, SP family, major inositol transporter